MKKTFCAIPREDGGWKIVETSSLEEKNTATKKTDCKEAKQQQGRLEHQQSVPVRTDDARANYKP